MRTVMFTRPQGTQGVNHRLVSSEGWARQGAGTRRRRLGTPARHCSGHCIRSHPGVGMRRSGLAGTKDARRPRVPICHTGDVDEARARPEV